MKRIRDYAGLGNNQVTILKILREGDLERALIFDEIRAKCYKDKDGSKSLTRARIRKSINSLKQRGIVEEHVGILTLNRK